MIVLEYQKINNNTGTPPPHPYLPLSPCLRLAVSGHLSALSWFCGPAQRRALCFPATLRPRLLYFPCCLVLPARCCVTSTHVTEYLLWAGNLRMHHFIISSNHPGCGQHYPHWKPGRPRQREGLTCLRQRSWQRIDGVFKSRSPRATFQCIASAPLPLSPVA